MFKRTLSALAVGAALAAVSMSPAQALQITAGKYKITLDGYAIGTAGYGTVDGTACNTVASCTTKASSPAGTDSDVAGILSVASINNLATGQDEYVRGTSSTLDGRSVGPYLTGVFSGLEDFFVDVDVAGVPPGGTDSVITTTAYALGGGFKIFENSANYDPSTGPGGLGSNLDLFQYAGISGGSLFLSGIFAPGILASNNTATYITKYTDSSPSGSGQGYLDFTGGWALSAFDTNAEQNSNGGFNDALLKITFSPTTLPWQQFVSGDVSGSIKNVPEPGSLALMSLALLGLGATTMRRRNKKD